MAGQNLAQDRGNRLIVAEHGTFDLAAVDAFLHQNLVVVLECVPHGAIEFFASADFMNADRRPEIGRFDE
jgi:hypothetical protein